MAYDPDTDIDPGYDIEGHAVDQSRELPAQTQALPVDQPSALPAAPRPRAFGMVQPGNIDLHNRPVVRNADGSISTVRSITIGGGENDEPVYVIPTVVDGHVVSNQDAVNYFRTTGEHLGQFDNLTDANMYAARLHREQAREYLTPPQRQALTPPRHPGQRLSPGEEFETVRSLGFTPEKPEVQHGFWHDAVQTTWQGILGLGSDLMGVADFTARQLDANPAIQKHIADMKAAITTQNERSLEDMSPAGQKALSASVMAYFNGGTDHEGNHIPTPGEVGWLRYFALNGFQLLPTVALAMIPASLASRFGIWTMGKLGFVTKAAEEAGGALKLTEAAEKVGEYAGMGGAGAAFSATNAGEVFNKFQEELKDAPLKEMQQSPVYNELIQRGMSDEQARAQILKQVGPSLMAKAAAIGFVAGTGITGLATGRAIGAAGARLRTRIAVGAGEGGAVMGAQGAANVATEQQAQMAAGTRENYDPSIMVANAVAMGLPGLAFGAFGAGAGKHLGIIRKDLPAPTPPVIPRGGEGEAGHGAEVDPAVAAALGAAAEGAGRPPRSPGEVLRSQPAGFGATPQGEMFQPSERGPTVQPGAPPVAPAPERTLPPPETTPIAPPGERTPGYQAPQPPSPALTEQGQPIVTGRPPEPGPGMPGAAQPSMFPTPGAGVAPGRQAEAFTPVEMTPAGRGPPATVPGAGMLPGEAEGGKPKQTEMFAPPPGAGPPTEPPPGGAAPPAGKRPSGTMKKAELDDALKTMGVDTKGMSRDDMARRFDREQARLNAGGQNTTVVNGAGSEAATTPATSERLGQAPSERAAPPAPGTSLPLAPEGALAARSRAEPQPEPTGQEPAEVRSEGGPAPGVASQPQVTTAEPPKAAAAKAVSKRAAATKEERAALLAAKLEAARKGVPFERTAGHVEAPTAGSREEFLAERREAEAREAQVAKARDEAAANVNQALHNATVNIVPLNKNDPRIQPALSKAVRNLLERVDNTDGSMAMISRGIHDFASEHPGDIPGTDTSWAEIADRIHREVVGKPLEGAEARFGREAAGEVQRQPGVVDTEAERRRVGKEELSAAEADVVHTEAPGREAEAPASRVEEQAAEHTAETGEAELTPASMTQQVATREEEAPSHPDITRRAAYYVRKMLAREIPPESADRAYGQPQPGRGADRQVGYRNLHEVVRNLLAKAEDKAGEAGVIKRFEKLAADKNITPQVRGNLKRKLERELSDYGEERAGQLRDILRRLSDPVGAAADDAERAATRAALRGKIDERTRDVPQDKPEPDGIDPRSSRYVLSTSQDPRVDATFRHQLELSEKYDVAYTSHDFLRDIIQDPLIDNELKPYRMLATQLLKLAPDTRIATLDYAVRNGIIERPLYERLVADRAYGAYDPNSDTILVNHDRPRKTGTHTETALHEIMHSVTWKYIENLESFQPNHPDLLALQYIRRELQSALDQGIQNKTMSPAEIARVKYAVSNLHELHTQLMTDPIVQGFAAGHNASNFLVTKLAKYGMGPGDVGRSIWRYFVGWMRKALGMPTPRSASEYTMLDHLVRPITEITERAAEWNKPAVLPKDPVLHAHAEPVYDGITASMSRRTRDMIEHVDPAGLGDRARRVALAVSNRDAIVDWNKDVLPSLLHWRTADENIRASSNEFAAKYGDKVQELAGRLNKADNKNSLFNLMTDVGIHEVHVGDSLTEAQQRTNRASPDAAVNLQRQYSSLSAKDKALYNDVKDLYNRTYADERKAQVESLINGYMPDATEAQREAFRNTVRSENSLASFLANPDHSALDEAFGDRWALERPIVTGMAKLHAMGFVKGDYFPLRRFGNYVVRYGDRTDPANYGVEMFESYTKAQQRRAELVRQGRDDVFQVARRDDTHLGDITSRPAFADELASAMARKGYGVAQIEHVTDLMNDILLRHATHSEAARARMQRRGVRGASTDQARVLASDFVSKQARYGYLLHGLDRARRLNEMHDEARALEGPSAAPGDAVRAMSVYQEAAKRTTKPEEHDNLLRKIGSTANGFSFVQSLMSVSHMLTSTLETHGNSIALLGARHGYTRTALALTRAMADASPAISGGVSNTIKAMGNKLKMSDWNLVKTVVDEMASKPGADRQLLTMLSNEAVRTGMIDHTYLQDIRQQMSPAGNIGTGVQKMWNIFYNSNAAMAHAVDVMNKLAVLKAAADLEMRRPGATRQSATDYAIQTTRRVMPNYTIGNRERLAQNPIMGSLLQFKRYGMHMYALMANLARESMHGPNKAESAKALAGILATHALMAGTITLIADPLRYIGGAYDILTGAPKFHNYENNVRDFMADTFGKEAGEIISRGLPHLAGMDIHRRVGLANLLEVPEMDGFNKAGAAQVPLGLATGATGENLQNLVDGLGKFMQGDVPGTVKAMAPRPFRDVYKGVEAATEGIKDKTGKVILPPEKVGTGGGVLQALGFQPAEVSEFREGRNAVLEAREEQRSERTQLVNRWLAASPTDRAAIQSQINQFNADPHNLAERIKQGDLLKQLNQRRKDETQKGGFGLRLPKKGAQQLMQAGSFANF